VQLLLHCTVAATQIQAQFHESIGKSFALVQPAIAPLLKYKIGQQGQSAPTSPAPQATPKQAPAPQPAPQPQAAPQATPKPTQPVQPTPAQKPTEEGRTAQGGFYASNSLLAHLQFQESEPESLSGSVKEPPKPTKPQSAPDPDSAVQAPAPTPAANSLLGDLLGDFTAPSAPASAPATPVKSDLLGDLLGGFSAPASAPATPATPKTSVLSDWDAFLSPSSAPKAAPSAAPKSAPSAGLLFDPLAPAPQPAQPSPAAQARPQQQQQLRSSPQAKAANSSAATGQTFASAEQARQAGLARQERERQEREDAIRREKELAESKANSESSEREKLEPIVSARVQNWAAKGGREGNIRALLCSLQEVLWEGSDWKPVNLSELLSDAQVKRVIRKAQLHVHPDKVAGGTTEEKMIAQRVFDVLQSCAARLN
jgi:hypothetical protein